MRDLSKDYFNDLKSFSILIANLFCAKILYFICTNTHLQVAKKKVDVHFVLKFSTRKKNILFSIAKIHTNYHHQLTKFY